MSKINVKTSLKNNITTILNNAIGIYTNNKIMYNEDKINVIISFKNNEIIIIRKNHQYELTLNFTTNKCNYLLKDYNKEINLTIKTKKITNLDNYLYIEYDLFDNDVLLDSFEFVLEYEVIK